MNLVCKKCNKVYVVAIDDPGMAKVKKAVCRDCGESLVESKGNKKSTYVFSIIRTLKYGRK